MSHSHSNFIAEYLEFAKFQRTQHVKAIKNFFKETIENRLLEGTYTSEEVEGILQDLSESICGEVESEVINTSHMNVLLLNQLFNQAENVGVTLHGSISEMQDGELLEAMRAEEIPNLSKIYSNNKVSFERDSQKESEICSPSKDSHDCEAAHENLKKILFKKNELIKSLREKLQQYEEENK